MFDGLLPSGIYHAPQSSVEKWLFKFMLLYMLNKCSHHTCWAGSETAASISVSSKCWICVGVEGICCVPLLTGTTGGDGICL